MRGITAAVFALLLVLVVSLPVVAEPNKPCSTGEFLVEAEPAAKGKPRRLEIVGCEPGTSIIVEEKDGKFTPPCTGPACATLSPGAVPPYFKFEGDRLFMVLPDGRRVEWHPLVETSEYVKQGRITPLIAPDILPAWRERRTASGQVLKNARAFSVFPPAEQIGLAR